MRPITFVLGTRPEIIKVAPLLREVASRDLPHVLIHTNQHYSPALDAIFFEQLRLAPPQHNLNVGAGSQTAQTARMMAGIDEILAATPASCLVVQGDTNSVLAGALTASKRDTPIAHVEAGLRSHDRAMPEEINRIITDHISDLLLTPTQDCSENLLAEGVDPQKIKLVGNTIVDSVMQNQSLISADLLDQYGLKPKEYFLATLHRPSNVDTEADLRELVETLAEVAEKSGFPMFFPAHPRTAGNLAKFGIDLPKSIMLHEPLGYFEFLTVQKYARVVLTDSGGVQEETCILGVPCLTLRTTTERPETVEVGANRLIGRNASAIMEAILDMTHQPKWKNPFGDGTASIQIIDLLVAQYS